MSAAPEWVGDVLEQHTQRLDFRADYLGCKCGARPGLSEHRTHVAQAIWDQVESRGNAGTLELTYQLTIDEPRTIPARSTDPGTSHAATEEIKVRAGSQRHYLLQSFEAFATHGLTDEQAMASSYGRVSPNSEYSKRCSELREAGFIEPTGETRKGASGMDRIVSRITDKGQEWVRRNEADQNERDWTTGPGGGRNT